MCVAMNDDDDAGGMGIFGSISLPPFVLAYLFQRDIGSYSGAVLKSPLKRRSHTSAPFHWSQELNSHPIVLIQVGAVS